jgi:hypothetical protein
LNINDKKKVYNVYIAIEVVVPMGMIVEISYKQVESFVSNG